MPRPDDLPELKALLRAAAADGRALSYSETLLALGERFSRPKMRALCRLLDAIDRDGAAAGEPELAVLVVRESDRLPGQGWWVGRRDAPADWTGPAAQAFVAGLQARAFAFWGRQPEMSANRPDPAPRRTAERLSDAAEPPAPRPETPAGNPDRPNR